MDRKGKKGRQDREKKRKKGDLQGATVLDVMNSIVNTGEDLRFRREMPQLRVVRQRKGIKSAILREEEKERGRANLRQKGGVYSS